MINLVLKVSIVSRYGVETIYPECETARKLCVLIQQRTFTQEDVRRIKDIGFAFEVVTKDERKTL